MEDNSSYVVISCKNLNLDKLASVYAYKEFIENCGKKSRYIIKGFPTKEVNSICDIFKIKLNSEEKVNDNDNIILIGIDSKLDVESDIKKENVTEIITSNANLNEFKEFIDANIFVENNQDNASIIAKRFIEYGMNISENSAILLYLAINKNLNIKKENKEIIEWLNSKLSDKIKLKIKEVINNNYFL